MNPVEVFVVWMVGKNNQVLGQPWVYWSRQEVLDAVDSFEARAVLVWKGEPEMYFSWNNFRELREKRA